MYHLSIHIVIFLSSVAGMSSPWPTIVFYQSHMNFYTFKHILEFMTVVYFIYKIT
jgi:hypothetical protein